MSVSMKKSQTELRVIFVIGGIVISILALTYILETIKPGLQSSPEAQAIMAAHFIASSANALAGMEMGYIKKEFSQPVKVEVYEKSGRLYVKVEQKGKSYKIPVLVRMEKTQPMELKTVYILKTPGRAVRISDEAGFIKEYFEGSRKGISNACEIEDFQLEKYITSASQRYGVDENLIKAVIAKETGFIHCKVGKDGDVGYMQLIPALVEDINSGYLKSYCKIRINPYNPEENILGGTCYLSYLINRYKSRGIYELEFPLTAYNCGPGNVDKLIKKYGSSWDSVKPHISEFCKSAAVTYAEDVMRFYRECYKPGGKCYAECKLCEEGEE